MHSIQQSKVKTYHWAITLSFKKLSSHRDWLFPSFFRSIYDYNLQSVGVDCRYTAQNHHHNANDQFRVWGNHSEIKTNQNIYMKHSGKGKDKCLCLFINCKLINKWTFHCSVSLCLSLCCHVSLNASCCVHSCLFSSLGLVLLPW